MSAQNHNSKPRLTQDPSSSGDQLSTKTDLLISLALHSWPALTLAIQNQWGGPTSNDKRDWFAGAVSDLLSTAQVSDVEDLEEVLLQVMLDEFEVVIDDDSAVEVAVKIIKGRQLLQQGSFDEVDQMFEKWQSQQQKGVAKVQFTKVDETEDGQDTDWDDDDDESDDEMEEAPPLVNVRPKKDKSLPEIDDDGFTKVTGRRKR